MLPRLSMVFVLTLVAVLGTACALFLVPLHSTIFQLPEIDAITDQFDGSSTAFADFFASTGKLPTRAVWEAWQLPSLERRSALPLPVTYL